jgi:integrase
MTWKVKKNQKRYKGEHCWEIDLRISLPDGTIKRERYKSRSTTKVGAQTEAADREAFLIRNPNEVTEKEGESEKAEVTFKDFYEEFSEKRKLDDLSPSYLDWMETSYNSRLAPTFDTMTMNQITQEFVNDFRRKLRNPGEGEGKALGKKASNNLLGFLGKICKAAVEKGIMTEVPKLPNFKIPKERIKIDGIECFNEIHLDKLLKAAKTLGSDHELVVLLGADAGLRRGEILGVIPSLDVKTHQGRHSLTVARSLYRSKGQVHVKPPKNGKTRSIPLTPRLYEALASRMRNSGYALQDEQGAALTPKQVSAWLREAQKAAGLEKTGRLHVLRHTFCSRLALSGAPLTVIQALADHANITTTERYMHSDRELENRAIDALTSPTVDNPNPPQNSGAELGQRNLKVVSG